MRWGVLAAAVVVSVTSAPVLAATSGVSSGRVVAHSPIIAVLDSGLRASHREFDYRGWRAANDQLVGWWDFTADKKPKVVLPRPGQRWDPQVRVPYDDAGHGSGVAAMAVGLNRSASKTPSSAPGYRLAVGKVLDSANAGQATLAAAITWATHTVHADVISISIGSPTPLPAAVSAQIFAAIDDAWQSGTLVVVANGNGWGDVGLVPGQPGWASDFGSSTHVLAVGESETQGVLDDTDPEVTAQGNVHTATNTGDDDYTDEGGSSFAAPFVAGFAARLIEAARQAGKRLSPDRLRELIEYSAVDTVRPPASEGYGEIALQQLAAALGYARSGGLPARPNPDPTGWYVDNVAMALRDAWSNQLRG